MPLMLGYSGSSDEALREYIAAKPRDLGGELDTLPVTSIGSTIGTHVGPGAIVVAFLPRKHSASNSFRFYCRSAESMI